MDQTTKNILMVAIPAFAALYVGDWIVLTIKVHKGQKPFETVQVENYSTVPEKNNRVEFFYGDPDTEECVHALFPHAGDNPCWYVSRHKDHRTDL